MDPLGLRNLHLWQLMTLCEAAWRVAGLDTALEVAHAVVVENTPVTLTFDAEARRLVVADAAGERAARLRRSALDATVRQTGEPLLQPGTISIVAPAGQIGVHAELTRYLAHLGYVEEAFEALELGQTSTAGPLEAIRVRIRARDANAEA